MGAWCINPHFSWRMSSSGMWLCVDPGLTEVSEERITSIFRVEKSASGEPASASGCSLYSHRCENTKSYTFLLTSALVGGEWSALRPGRFTPGTHWIRGLVDPTAGLDDVEKRKFSTISGLELQLLGRPARSQSLYRLHYPGSPFVYVFFFSFFGWGETESTWYVGRYFAYCTNPGW
jgi:hypothetical protein